MTAETPTEARVAMSFPHVAAEVEAEVVVVAEVAEATEVWITECTLICVAI
jgi:hypothetical protein